LLIGWAALGAAADQTAVSTRFSPHAWLSGASGDYGAERASGMIWPRTAPGEVASDAPRDGGLVQSMAGLALGGERMARLAVEAVADSEALAALLGGRLVASAPGRESRTSAQTDPSVSAVEALITNACRATYDQSAGFAMAAWDPIGRNLMAAGSGFDDLVLELGAAPPVNRAVLEAVDPPASRLLGISAPSRAASAPEPTTLALLTFVSVLLAARRCRRPSRR
jgi:hypothetical protein